MTKGKYARNVDKRKRTTTTRNWLAQREVAKLPAGSEAKGHKLVHRRKQITYKAKREKEGYPVSFCAHMTPEAWDALRSIGRTRGYLDAPSSLIVRAALAWFAGAVLTQEVSETMPPADQQLLRTLCEEGERSEGEVMAVALRWLKRAVDKGETIEV